MLSIRKFQCSLTCYPHELFALTPFHFILRIAFVFLFIFSTPVIDLLGQNESNQSILFENGTKVYVENIDDISSEVSLSGTPSTNGFYYRFIQLFDIPTSNTRNALEALGIELLEYIPNKTFSCCYSPIA